MEDYKEKYEQAIENIKKIKDANKDNKELVDFIEYKYPELKDSEDEKIRKEIISWLQNTEGQVLPIDRYNAALTWLEKQGHDGKMWIYRDVYLKEKEQLVQDGIDDVLQHPQKYGLEKQGEQKPAWSEEDEKECKRVVGLLEGWLSTFNETSYAEDCKRGISWLNSLKQRMKGE